MKYPFLLLVSFLLFFSCKNPEENQIPYVVMVSFDGFRYDYASQHEMPHLNEFIKNGAQAEAMLPSFPSKTFPNHYSLVTGMYPGHHGLVDNDFYDPDRKLTYDIKNRTMVEDPDFYGGTPLWQLAQEQGVHAASYFWVGSEAPIGGIFPDYSFKYDQSVPNNDRIEQINKWLQLPEEKRPHFISLYFSLLDTQGHNFGPNSPEIAEALKEADNLIGKLKEKVDESGLPVNMIIVSDHGMLELNDDEASYVYLKEFLNTNDSSYTYVNSGTHVHIYTKTDQITDSLYNSISREIKNAKVYKRSELPASWHYDYPKVGELLIAADPGYYVVNSTRKDFAVNIVKGRKLGKHGYDPDEVKDVSGIFYANGPNIKTGITIPPFRNIHVYPLVAKILNLKVPEDIDGDEKVLNKVYQQ